MAPWIRKLIKLIIFFRTLVIFIMELILVMAFTLRCKNNSKLIFNYFIKILIFNLCIFFIFMKHALFFINNVIFGLQTPKFHLVIT
jgi:hypothetical protein